MNELIELPGVGRKTANIVLDNAYGIIEGIAVDTHVRRVSYRLGLTTHSNAEKIEQDLMRLLPREKWSNITNILIDHGRAVCKAPVPFCSKCIVNKKCPKYGVDKRK
jgi:endonuclease-3